MVSPFNPFLNGDNKTIFKNLEQEFELGHTKLKPKLSDTFNFSNVFGCRDEGADKNDCFHGTLISPSLKLNC